MESTTVASSSCSSPRDHPQPPAMGDNQAPAGTTAATRFGPVIGIVVAAERDVLDPSKDIGIAMGLTALSIGCAPEEDAALHACYDEGAITPEKEACDKAADALRRCLKDKVDMVKAVAAWANGGEEWLTCRGRARKY